MQNMSFKPFEKNKMLETLLKNKVFNELTKNFDLEAKQLMEDQNIKSIIIGPNF